MLYCCFGQALFSLKITLAARRRLAYLTHHCGTIYDLCAGFYSCDNIAKWSPTLIKHSWLLMSPLNLHLGQALTNCIPQTLPSHRCTDMDGFASGEQSLGLAQPALAWCEAHSVLLLRALCCDRCNPMCWRRKVCLVWKLKSSRFLQR